MKISVAFFAAFALTQLAACGGSQSSSSPKTMDGGRNTCAIVSDRGGLGMFDIGSRSECSVNGINQVIRDTGTDPRPDSGRFQFVTIWGYSPYQMSDMGGGSVTGTCTNPQCNVSLMGVRLRDCNYSRNPRLIPPGVRCIASDLTFTPNFR